MSSTGRAIFRNLGIEGWLNLAVASLLVFYLVQCILDLLWGNLFGNLAVDFGSFWSAGYIANRFGYADVYDVDLMGRVQHELVPLRAAVLQGWRPSPTAYLPLFLLPFQLLALLPPAPAALLWMAVNLIGSVLYLIWFARRLRGEKPRTQVIALVLASVPVFLNAFLGQTNLWMMICVGEFVLATQGGRRFASGMWLAGLLLKPQILVLIVPAFLVQRWWRPAAGMLAGFAVIMLTSWIAAGTAGLARLAHLWLGFASGLPSNDPQLMINWRMLGEHLIPFLGSEWAAGVVGLGMLGTAALAVGMWIRPLPLGTTAWAIALLGLFAAAALFSWHAHTHMAMILIPLLLLLIAERVESAVRWVRWWVLLPALLYVLRYPLAALVRLAHLGTQAFSALDLLAGVGLFSMNIALLTWAVRRLMPSSTQAVTP